MTTTIRNPTNPLEAVALWAPSVDVRSHISQILIADGELVATDGMRGVRVPIETHDQTLSFWRADALMAVAAQDALVQHDKRMVPRRRGARTIGVEAIDGGRLRLQLEPDGTSSIIVRACTQPFPLEPLREIFQTVSSAKRSMPDGIRFNPEMLASIAEVQRAIDAGQTGVRIVQWGGPTDPVLFEGPALDGCKPSRFVVMPMMVQ